MLNMSIQYSEPFGLVLKLEVMYQEIHYIPSACNRFFNVCYMSFLSSSSTSFLFLRSSGVWMVSLCCPSAASYQLWRETKRWCLPLLHPRLSSVSFSDFFWTWKFQWRLFVGSSDSHPYRGTLKCPLLHFVTTDSVIFQCFYFCSCHTDCY